MDETKNNRTFLLILVGLGLLVAGIVLRPKLAEQLAPRLTAVHVAIEPAGSGVARVGRVELTEGQAFQLRAVVEARRRNGDPVYYTDASRLQIGNEEIAAERLEPWSRNDIIKLRWFTVEGKTPYVRLSPGSGIDNFRMEEFARSDWPMAWTIPGEIDAANDNHFSGGKAAAQSFGTQRYHLRFEIYAAEKDLVPIETLRSWGVSELRAEIERFPAVVVSVPGPTGPMSRVFGLTQLEPPADGDAALLSQIDELHRHGVAFSRFTLLRELVSSHNKLWQDLRWQTLSLAGDTAWRTAAGSADAGVAAGDLLRVGDRVVVLYRDAGLPQKLDPEDLAFDFERGARLSPLREIFSGDGELEHHALAAD